MPKKNKTDDGTKILEDWLTFPFTNVRIGTKGWTSEWTSDIYNWKPRMYCMSCGALWSMAMKDDECNDCEESDLRMLVCRYRTITKRVPIPIVWYRPSTWSGYEIKYDGVWEYRLKESEARTGVLF